MHLSMHNWMRAEPIEVTLARLSKYGYESIEISGEPEQYKPDEVRPLLEKYKLRCWGSCSTPRTASTWSLRSTARR
jgi:sugar phosphate isomerase/epimerase